MLNSFAEKVVKAMKGEKGIVEPSFVYLPGIEGGESIAKATGLDYFSVPIALGVSAPSEFMVNANRIHCSHQGRSRQSIS